MVEKTEDSKQGSQGSVHRRNHVTKEFRLARPTLHTDARSVDVGIHSYAVVIVTEPIVL